MGGSGWLRRFGVGLVAGSLVASLFVLPVAVEAAPVQGSSEGFETVERPPVPDVPPIVSEDPPDNAGPLAPPAEPDTTDAEPTPLDLALDAARESGEPVEVEELRSEATTVYANPSGSITEETAAAPIRVETDGGWVPVDPTLEVTESGVAPVAVPGEVSLSGGGDEPLLEVVPEDAGEVAGRGVVPESVGVDVAGGLPVPVLDGATATYADALDGSDLVVTASAVGTEV